MSINRYHYRLPFRSSEHNSSVILDADGRVPGTEVEIAWLNELFAMERRESEYPRWQYLDQRVDELGRTWYLVPPEYRGERHEHHRRREFTKEWCMNAARAEGDHEIAAGAAARDPEYRRPDLPLSASDAWRLQRVEGLVAILMDRLGIRVEGIDDWVRSVGEGRRRAG